MKKETSKIIIGILIGMVLLISAISILADKNILLAPLSSKETFLTSTEQNEIISIKSSLKTGDQTFPDYKPLYNLLETKAGQYGKISTICSEFNPLFCLKKASQQNPELRNEICPALSEKLHSVYGERMTSEQLSSFIEGHMIDCEAGVQQYVY